jgi:hypothetical protein
MMGLGGNGSADLVSFIDAPLYFQSRSIEVKPEKMVELAEKAPKDQREAIGQLLAIRWLGDHGAEVKKTKKAREVLEQLAASSTGAGTAGFARDYARTALARLDGKPIPGEPLPANSVRSEALSWFPARCSLFGALDLRLPEGITATADDSSRAVLGKMMDQRAREEMYKVVEGIGNVRVDRASFGVIPDPNNDRKTRLYMRITGKGDAAAIVAYLAQQMKDLKVGKRKGPSGEEITVADSKRMGPAMIFVGDSDLVITGFPGAGGGVVDNGPLIEEVVNLMAGKKKSLVTGSYASTLKSTPRGASGLIIGNLPETWRKAFTSRGSPFQAVPQYFNVTMTRTAKGLRVRLTGSAENAREAKTFVDSVTRLKEMAVEGLKKLPEGFKLKQKTIDAVLAALKSVKLEAKDALLTGSATLSNEALKGGYEIMFLGLLFLDPVRAARPVRVEEKKRDP